MVIKRISTSILYSALCVCLYGQKAWTVDDCMQYAAEHNHEVRLEQIALDDYKSNKKSAIGAFLPSVSASISGNYNFGRAIDPETNTYTNVGTFNNGYSISTSIPVFDGWQRYNNVRLAKVSVLLGRQNILAQKDNVCQQVFQAFIDVLYYKGAVAMAEDKREESMMLLKQTKVMEEIGTKGEADVAQMQANFAADDYEVTRQKGLLENALLALKQQMNFPTDEELFIANDVIIPNTHIVLEQDILTLVETGSELPLIKQARYNLQSAEYSYRASKGALLPSLSLGAGMSTAYNKQLGNADTRSFREQFRNNTGRNVYASISIPIFNRLSTLTSIRRARNNVTRAKENLDHQQDELRRLIQGTIIEKENYRKETEKMTKKVESDSIASRLTIRKYEEGLASPIEVKTAGVTLLQSKAQLLQCQLMYAYKSRILEYYKGIPLWTE